MSDLIIEAMSEQDIDSVLSIETASFRRPWSRNAFLTELACEYSHNLVLKLENSSETYQIIAYLCSRIITDEVHIVKLAVHPEQRRKGVAFKFLNHCLARVCDRNIRSVILEVRQTNAAGIGLYKKTGFDMEAQLPNYFLDTREDAILMRKNF